MDRKSTSNESTLLDMKFHENGTELWLMSKNSHIIVIDTQQFHVTKVVSSPDRYHVKKLSFVSSAFAQDVIHKSSSLPFRSICIGATSTKELVFLAETNTNNAIDFKSFLPWKCAAVKHFLISPNSKLLAIITGDGTLKLYSIEFMLRQIYYTMQPKIITTDHVNTQLNGSSYTLDKKVVFTRSNFIIVPK